jgi:phytoene dehydrogenase-like protein
VASNLNPQQTFLDLVGEENLEKGFAERVRGFRYSTSTPVFSIHLALNNAPDYLAAKYDPAVNKAWLMAVGVDTLEDIQRTLDQSAAGVIPNPIGLIGMSPTVWDPTQAPPGKHTSLMWHTPCPYLLADGGPQKWDEIIHEHGARVLARWAQYAPNLNKENILSCLFASPLDVERHYPNMANGDWMCGALSTDQFLDKRPLPELSQYRTPVEGLYLCGSSCHPGGNITGAPGYNAAGIIAQDLGLERWWNPHDLEKVWGAIPKSEANA